MAWSGGAAGQRRRDENPGVHLRSAETKQLQVKSKAEAQPSKRVLAQRAAATAGGARTPWGSESHWSETAGGRSRVSCA